MACTTRTLSARGVAWAVLSLTLSGCASKLPGPEADAFKLIAEADQAAFLELSDQRLAAQTNFAKRAVLTGDGRVVVDPGCVSSSLGNCMVSYKLDSEENRFALNQPPGKLQATLGSLSRYGGAMAELAEAKDIDAVGAKAGAAAGAAKSLILTIAPEAAIIGPLIDLGVLAAKASLRDKRRRLLLAVAEQADPGIQKAVILFNGTLNPTIRDIEANARAEVKYLNIQMTEAKKEELRLGKIGRRTPDQDKRLATLRQRQSDDLDRMVTSATRLNAVRSIDLDFSTLGKAHGELLEKLRNLDTDSEELFKNLNQVLVLIDQIKAATKKDS